MKVNRKMVVCDLDGTLLDNTGKISAKTEEAVKKFAAAGHLFCIATGRPRRSAVTFYNQLELNTVMCNFNGAYINNPADASFMPLNFTFSREIVHLIIEDKIIAKHIENAVVETVEATFMLRKPKNETEYKKLLDQFHIVYGRDDVVFMKKPRAELRTDPNSVLLLLSDRATVRIIRERVRKLSRTLILREWSIPVSNTYALEINSIFANKGMAVKYLSAYYNVPLQDIYSFGDGVNDMEMLDKAGESFAMANANDGIKATAKYETEFTNEKDGVAAELQRIFELRG